MHLGTSTDQAKFNQKLPRTFAAQIAKQAVVAENITVSIGVDIDTTDDADQLILSIKQRSTRVAGGHPDLLTRFKTPPLRITFRERSAKFYLSIHDLTDAVLTACRTIKALSPDVLPPVSSA